MAELAQRLDAAMIAIEPPIPNTTEFSDVAQVRGVIHQLDNGDLRQPALLIERMLWNPRLRAVLETRLAGLISAEIQFEPSQNNRAGRRAARELADDWPIIAPAPMRKQMLTWALFLGVGLAQRFLGESPSSGRSVLKLRPYWPGFAYWYWYAQAYRIQTANGVVEVASPSLTRDDREAAAPVKPVVPLAPVDKYDESPWVIAEPYGLNSYRNGLVHAAWRPWLGHEWAMRDQARASEKHGIGVIKAQYPRGQGQEHQAALAMFIRGLRNMGSEGTIPCEQRGEGEPGFNAEPFEFNGSGFNAISDTMNSNAVALAILLLGHNLTTEIKGGGSYAAANVGDLVRDDKKEDDANIEYAYIGPQLIAPWAELNYGDPGLAPKARYVTDSPSVNKTRAEMINAMAMATTQLRANVPRVDLEQLAEEFRLPLLPEGATVQVPGPATPPTPAPSTTATPTTEGP